MFVFSGEFTLYDHVLDHSAAFNVIPPRYPTQQLSALDTYFAMGRGRQADGVDVPASEMKKWYEYSISHRANCHFVQPGSIQTTTLSSLNSPKLPSPSC
jgi:5-methyltetrahydropteroyltriglutamate--homocysteine methyltransferase